MLYELYAMHYLLYKKLSTISQAPKTEKFAISWYLAYGNCCDIITLLCRPKEHINQAKQEELKDTDLEDD